MKRYLALLLSLLTCFVFAACAHSHTWIEADCLTPKTCSSCKEFEGEALGHLWQEATCEKPKYCIRCGVVEGEALGHEWNEATCEKPKTCATCGSLYRFEDGTDGKALGHTWVEATCYDAKTCSVCGKTQGDPLGHSVDFPSCTEDGVCSLCGETVTAPGHDIKDATCTEASVCKVCGEVQGEPLGHSTPSGVCSRCGIEHYETINGHGDDVVANVEVGDGIYRAHFHHQGRRNFIVHLFTEDDKDLLINEIGKYDGYVLLMAKGPYTFEIDADGDWDFTIEPLEEISATEFSGKGDYVTGRCSLTSGAWEFTHDGKHNFIVHLYTTDGRDLLVNEIGQYSGKKMLTIPVGSSAIFEITADGNWTIHKAD